ncbi:hypothetical protein JCM10449v2_002957 [Rhodotorula kratochvilovae]
MSASRPAVKRQYGARKSAGAIASSAASSPSTSRRRAPSTAPSSSPPRLRAHQLAAPSSDWSDAVAETFSSPGAGMTQDKGKARASTPPMSQEQGDEEPKTTRVGGRALRERRTPTKPLPPPAGAATKPKGDLRSFFQRTSPRKRQRLSSPYAEDGDIERAASMARTSSSGSSTSAASSSSSRTSLSSASSAASSSKPVKLEQLYLDPFRTAGHATLSCAVCALSYARTPEDLAFHDRHHKKVVGGCDWVASDEGRGVTVLDEAADWGDKRAGRVLMVDYPATDAPLRRKLKDVLETIDTELSSTALTPDQLALAKIFLFVTPQRKVIACAVVQRISAAYQVVREKKGGEAEEPSKDLLRFGEDQGAIFCSPTPLPTLLGIQRIWTSTSARRHGLASRLLDFAAAKYVYGSPIARERRAADFAFSQPTGKGQKLARAWTGTEAFKVFVD